MRAGLEFGARAAIRIFLHRSERKIHLDLHEMHVVRRPGPADQRRVVSGIAILEMSGIKIENTREERAEHVAGVAFGHRVVEHAEDLVRTVLQMSEASEQRQHDRHVQRGGNALARNVADAEEELADGRKKLEDAKKEVEDGWKKLHDGETDIKKAQKEVNDAQKELDSKALELEEGIKKYEEGKAQLEKGQKELENGYAQLEQMKLFMPSEMYEAQRLQLDEKKIQVEEGLKTLKTTKKQLDDGAALLEDGKKQLEQYNKLLNDEYILDLAEIEDYPSYVKTKTGNIRKKILTSPYISEVKVNKHFLGVIEIEVKESKVLFYKEYDKKYLLDNGEELDKLDYNYSPVILTNYVPSDIYESFVKAYKKIDENVQSKISQIKYDPNEFDNGRFLFYMNDGNYVYITITKMDNINYYNSIIPTLNDEKGTLYLDSGNHFVKF